MSPIPHSHQSERRDEGTSSGVRLDGAAPFRLADHAHNEDRVAVAMGGDRLTYPELLGMVGRVSAYVGAHVSAPNGIVAVMVDRCLELPAVLLGILNSGRAYLPLDPVFPRQRIAWMLESAAVDLVIVDEDPPASDLGGIGRVVSVNEVLSFSAEVDRDSSTTTPRELPASLAYLLFTSGSTGRPKGVSIPRSALFNFLNSMARVPGMSADDRLLAVTTISFDIAALELLLPLWCGGTVVIATRDQAADGWQLAELIQRHSITVMQATPATWQMLIDSGWSGTPGLKVLCGGEALQPGLAGQLVSRCGELWNMYGPTETTIWSSAQRIGPHAPDEVGGAIANTQLHVLKADGTPAAEAETGELWIGGAGVALGYLNQPALTAERFVSDPFAEEPGARFYRTGDLVRKGANGRIHFIGRVDNQVKVRGFRIELGEIEAHLARHEGVRQAIVVPRGGDHSEPELVACFIPEPPETSGPSTASLREHCRQTLPDYMIPSRFVPMASFPLTPNNKIDRGRLAGSKFETVENRTVESPATAAEEYLLTIWRDQFGGREFGVTDDFFEIGGHSLIAARIMARVQKAFGRTIPMVTFFEAPTVRKLASLLEDRNWSPRWTSLVPIKPTGNRPPLFCLHGVGGNILEFYDLVTYLSPDQPMYGIQAQGLDGRSPRHRTVDEMADHYVGEIVGFHPQGPFFLCGSSFGGIVAYEVASRLKRLGHEVRLLGMFDTFAPGYPKYPESTGKVLRKLFHLRTRIHLHWSNIMLSREKQRDTYIREKAVRLRKRLVGNTRKFLQRTATRIKRLLLPSAIRQVQASGFEAHRAYEARPDDLHVVLFRASEQPYGCIPDESNGWQSFALGGVETLTIPGHHGAIMREPRVSQLSAALNRKLDELQ